MLELTVKSNTVSEITTVYRSGSFTTKSILIDGRSVNASYHEGKYDIVILMYASVDITDFYGNKLKDESQSREDVKVVGEWIEKEFADYSISTNTGWSTKNQWWKEWRISKNSDNE